MFTLPTKRVLVIKTNCSSVGSRIDITDIPLVYHYLITTQWEISLIFSLSFLTPP